MFADTNWNNKMVKRIFKRCCKKKKKKKNGIDTTKIPQVRGRGLFTFGLYPRLWNDQNSRAWG